MKILFVTNLYPTQRNPDYGVFTKEQIDGVMSKGISGDVLFVNAKELGVKEYLVAFRKIKKIYKSYDIIHCFHGLTLIVTFFATKRKKILVSFLNSIEYESLKGNRILNYFLHKIYAFLLGSKRVYKIFKDKVPQKYASHSFYLPNGVDLNCFFPISKEEACKKLGLDPSKTYILFVSAKDTQRAQKRFDIYKKTMDVLNNSPTKFQFDELIMSQVPRSLCIYYFNAASLHLLTSDYEGSPNSVKEAMSCNIPVVSTDVGNVKQMIVGAGNCFVVDQNPILLAKKVIEAIESPSCDLREVLISNGLTKEEKTKELINIYRSIKP